MARSNIDARQSFIRAKCERCAEEVELLSNPFGAPGYVGLCSRREKPWKRCGGKLMPMSRPERATYRSVKALTPTEQEAKELEESLEKMADDVGRED